MKLAVLSVDGVLEKERKKEVLVGLCATINTLSPSV